MSHDRDHRLNRGDPRWSALGHPSFAATERRYVKARKSRSSSRRVAQSLLADARLAGVFGQFRQDAIYLIPVWATLTSSSVTVFVGGGTYPLAVLPFPLAPGEETLPLGLVFKGDVRPPNDDALRALVERELPQATR